MALLGESLVQRLLYGEQDPTKTATAYTAGDYRHLGEVKHLYDPDNTFRANHNIPQPIPVPASTRSLCGMSDDQRPPQTQPATRTHHHTGRKS
jgi:hypothetical protein